MTEPLATPIMYIRGEPPEEAGEPLVLGGRDAETITEAVESLKEKARKALAPGTRFEIRQVTPDAGIEKPFLAWYWSREMNERLEWKTGPVGFDVATGITIVERCLA